MLLNRTNLRASPSRGVQGPSDEPKSRSKDQDDDREEARDVARKLPIFPFARLSRWRRSSLWGVPRVPAWPIDSARRM
ncbi:unnamed protein product [Brassica oleracea]|uniref:Uncharacterized protein n=1 Tax=Brassica oleracea TaxID=3712 RepID=A0A3P6AR23_BRAOL|nr:unnamed protein product [Brassica oleracea]